jgi:hypothetical protein
MALAITGVKGLIKWSYYTAAQIEGYAIYRDHDGHARLVGCLQDEATAVDVRRALSERNVCVVFEGASGLRLSRATTGARTRGMALAD